MLARVADRNERKVLHALLHLGCFKGRAFKLPAKESIARLKHQALWLKREHPRAAVSLLEGLKKMFTVNALGLTPSLMRRLSSINVIENPNGRMRSLSRNVTALARWRNGRALGRGVLP